MKIRIISAVVALVIILPIVIIGGVPFAIAAAALGVIALYEMIHLRETQKKVPKLVQGLSYIILLSIIASNIFVDYNIGYNFGISELAVILFFLFVPIVYYRNMDVYSVNDASFLLLSVLYIGIPFNYFILARDFGLELVIYIAIIAVLTDSMAYFSGYFFGKNKLIPEISPKKTVEGAIGGTFFGVLFGSMFLMYIDFPLPMYMIIIMSLVLSILGQIGDLVASGIKRGYQIKDFGNIMPGHGGVLDRFDNLMFVIAGLVVFLDIFTKINIGG